MSFVSDFSRRFACDEDVSIGIRRRERRGGVAAIGADIIARVDALRTQVHARYGAHSAMAKRWSTVRVLVWDMDIS